MTAIRNVNTTIANRIAAGETLYIVYRTCEGDNWYWGAWENLSGAFSAAVDIGGAVEVSTSVHILDTNPWA